MRNTVVAAFLLISGWPAYGQQGIQQPVVGSTSVSTSVSVPDRGSVFLGGVSSAQSARGQYGPLRSGTFRGMARQATSISTNVHIHDLHAMDEALLSSGNPGARPGAAAAPRPEASAAGPAGSQHPSPSPAEKAAKFERLAQRADDAGKHSVARLHWQAAARYGSKRAETRLAEMSQVNLPQTAR